MKEIKDYLDRTTWPEGRNSLKVREFVELTAICREMTAGMDPEKAFSKAVLEAMTAGYAAGFERGQRKAENAQKRARHSRREKEAAEGAETA